MVDFMAYAMDFIQVAGLLAVFILLVLDGAMLLPAVPGEVVLIIAVAVWGDTIGGLIQVFLIAVAAAMVGALLIYGIGRAAARNAATKRKAVLGISPKRQEKMQQTFSKPSGQALLFVGRLFPLTRIIVSLPAGIARMPFWRFTILSTIGTAIFYGGFLWLTWEFSRQDSQIKASADGAKAAYATPAWQFIEANWIASVVFVILVGIVLSIRASHRMSQDHEETGGSLIGTAATAALFWGGIALLAGLWVDYRLVYSFLELGGIPITSWNTGIPFEPLSILIAIGVVFILFGIMLRSFRKAARASNKRLRLEHNKLEFQGRLARADAQRGEVAASHRRQAAKRAKREAKAGEKAGTVR